MPHVHASDGDCSCHYEARRCVGGCGRVGTIQRGERFVCTQCERAEPTVPAHWDDQLRVVEETTARVAETWWNPPAQVGVAVDDASKRDYFVSKLREMMRRHAWAGLVTFLVVPMNGAEPIEVSAP